ncbi:hypothetical protein M438DRAFT_39197 [Aureobasidium pullulans EXF-150]|uniref:C2H2-type domain-containing protein n=1 Tax=Aureobasidium pullulans EXF-150 TaxID=1043002 RepID=A0A074XH08_AURPU|nr:uncharacterized protein M438DRAFT_39197 [Aureobasidium pullulans EXF-150]KEQ82994.1 hypothetical protein M438DRAFT_39197 [Aureobasidium pullulans EXF-150]
MVLALAQDAHIEVLELLKAVEEDISSLFKLSSLVEKVTYRDDYAIAGAAIHDTQILHKELEVRDIQDHFPRLKGSVWLLQRLVQANSARRKYLRYRAFHHDRVLVSSQHVLKQGDDNEVSMEDKIPSIHHSDQISMADVNTTGWGSLQEKDEDDHMSQASRDHSIPEISLNQIPTVHTLKELCQDGEVFVCPYCKDKQAMTTEAAWRSHMFSDLKAYVCLAEDCELYMFTSSEAWMSHQLSEHLVVWNCPICDETPFFSGEYFQSHIRFCHPAEFSEEQLEQLTTSSKHSADSIRASECPFCDWAIASGDLDICTFQYGEVHVTPELFQRHVCSHLEQLALSASLWTEEDDRKDRIETGSRQDHIAMILDGFSATIRNLKNTDAVNEAYTGINEGDPFPLQQRSWGFDVQSYNPHYGLDDMSFRTHSSTTSGTRNSNTSRAGSSTTSRTYSSNTSRSYSSNTSRTYSSNTSSAESGTTSSRPYSSLVFPRNLSERYNYTNEQPIRHQEVDLSNQWTGMYWEMAEAEKQFRSRVSNMRAALELQGQTSEEEEEPATLVAPSRSREFSAHSSTKDAL